MSREAETRVISRKNSIMARLSQSELKQDGLEQIKRLLVLALIHQGVQGKDIAAALGVDPATVTRMVPARSVKKK